jgi:hypothetical protein
MNCELKLLVLSQRMRMSSTTLNPSHFIIGEEGRREAADYALPGAGGRRSQFNQTMPTEITT